MFLFKNKIKKLFFKTEDYSQYFMRKAEYLDLLSKVSRVLCFYSKGNYSCCSILALYLGYTVLSHWTERLVRKLNLKMYAWTKLYRFPALSSERNISFYNTFLSRGVAKLWNDVFFEFFISLTQSLFKCFVPFSKQLSKDVVVDLLLKTLEQIPETPYGSKSI